MLSFLSRDFNFKIVSWNVNGVKAWLVCIISSVMIRLICYSVMPLKLSAAVYVLLLLFFYTF